MLVVSGELNPLWEEFRFAPTLTRKLLSNPGNHGRNRFGL